MQTLPQQGILTAFRAGTTFVGIVRDTIRTPDDLDHRDSLVQLRNQPWLTRVVLLITSDAPSITRDARPITRDAPSITRVPAPITRVPAPITRSSVTGGASPVIGGASCVMGRTTRAARRTRPAPASPSFGDRCRSPPQWTGRRRETHSSG
ncbi:hypothetical protein DMA12_22250 [Amycolatopsis balhimycina DSM 5908]|uniref:Uncharacterized protein n=1 Tax=Amycolatopsis balhimycina DSM 5908 TaxID=1081091 RepID=A0A428WGU5_AMYBA|nr:hypothetical protein DMA12_22250 [Amycolatopsis balhimycina DSM 5908]